VQALKSGSQQTQTTYLYRILVSVVWQKLLGIKGAILMLQNKEGDRYPLFLTRGEYTISCDLPNPDSVNDKRSNFWINIDFNNKEITQFSKEVPHSIKHHSELDKLSDFLEIPNEIKNEALELYHKAQQQQMIKGRTIHGMVAASLYIVIRIKEFPRTFNQIVSASQSDKKEISRCYKVLCSGFNIKPPPIDVTKMVPWFRTILELSDSVQRRAIQILEVASKMKITSGYQPVSLVAAAVYIASIEMNERRNQLDVSKVALITDITLRNRYKELRRKLKIQINV